MNVYNILTSGEKIKKIRSDFDLKQEDVTGGEITRNLVSIVENNKASLTEHVANILVENINSICEERGIDFRVTAEYLLEDVLSQARKVVLEYIEVIKTIDTNDTKKFEEILVDIDVFLKSYETDENKSILYIQIAKKFKSINQYSKAVDYLLKAYESSMNKESTTKSLLLLCKYNIFMAKYDDSIKYGNILLKLNDDVKIQYHTKYNIALCNKKLNKYEESISILKAIVKNHDEILSKSKKEYMDVYLLMGSCLFELGMFNKSIAIYKDLLKLVETEKEEICIMSNLSDVYNKIHDSKNLERNNSKILKIINSNQNILEDYESYVYLSLAKNINPSHENYDLIVSLLSKSLNNFKLGKCPMYSEDIEEVLGLLLNTFIINDESQIELLKNEMLELIERKLLSRCNDIVLKIIRYYNYKDKKNEITDLINYLVS